MATITSFKTMFQRLGFPEDAATQLSSESGEGLSSLDAIKALSDKPSPLSDDSCVAASSENPRRWNIVLNEAIVAILTGSLWLCGSWQRGKGF